MLKFKTLMNILYGGNNAINVSGSVTATIMMHAKPGFLINLFKQIYYYGRHIGFLS